MTRILIVVALSLTALNTLPALAVPTWTGAGGDGRWTTAANWTGGVPTQFGVSTVDFHAAGATNLTTDVFTGGQFFVQDVRTTADATSFAINNSAGGELAVSGDVYINSGAANLAAQINYPIFFNKVANTTLTFNVDGAGRSLSINQVHRHVAGGLRPGQTLIKSGSGKMTITGNSTYHGETRVNGGTLLINGTPVNGSGAVVNNSGTLGGTGTFLQAVAVNAGGALAPGASIGTFNTGSLNFAAASSTLAIEIDPMAVSADLANVAGTVTLAGSTLAFSFANATPVASPTTFLILANDGVDSIAGTFGTISGIPASFGYAIDYAFLGTDALGRVGSGNDLAVTLLPIPEAGAWMLGSAVALTVAAWRIKQRRTAAA